MRYMSLFSGCGGIDLALRQAGLACVAQSEIDRDASAVLRRHFPDVPNLGDVRGVDGRRFSGIDLIAGGFPCQDVSVAGDRAGLACERSGLWREFQRVISEARPSWVLIENVPGLLSSASGRDFGRILTGLDELGYVGAWRVLDAQYWGIPQRRRRVFLVGCLGTLGADPGSVLFEPAGVRGNPQARRTERQTIAAAVTGSFGHHGRSTPRGDGSDNLIAGTIEAHHCPRYDGDTETFIPVPLASPVGSHNWRQDLDNDTYVVNLRGREGGAMPEMDSLASVRAASGGSTRSYPVGNFGVRRLLPVECERLQGLPDGWTEWSVSEAGERVVLSDSARYRLIGNSVAVPVVAWIAERLRQEHECGDRPQVA